MVKVCILPAQAERILKPAPAFHDSAEDIAILFLITVPIKQPHFKAKSGVVLFLCQLLLIFKIKPLHSFLLSLGKQAIKTNRIQKSKISICLSPLQRDQLLCQLQLFFAVPAFLLRCKQALHFLFLLNPLHFLPCSDCKKQNQKNKKKPSAKNPSFPIMLQLQLTQQSFHTRAASSRGFVQTLRRKLSKLLRHFSSLLLINISKKPPQCINIRPRIYSASLQLLRCCKSRCCCLLFLFTTGFCRRSIIYQIKFSSVCQHDICRL